MSFVDKTYLRKIFCGNRVVIVGSAPTALENNGIEIDGYDVVVRVNNYKTLGFEGQVGKRTDVHYAFYGSSIRKTADELKRDGVFLCMCKCPDAKVHETQWHKEKGGKVGCDFRYIYTRRKDFWFTNTYIPTEEQYMKFFNMLGQHVPTTGFAAILEIIEETPSELYITGFTFMKCEACGKRGWDCKCTRPQTLHNINERWRRKNEDDPIRHEPEREYQILQKLAKEHSFIKLDKPLG